MCSRQTWRASRVWYTRGVVGHQPSLTTLLCSFCSNRWKRRGISWTRHSTLHWSCWWCVAYAPASALWRVRALTPPPIEALSLFFRDVHPDGPDAQVSISFQFALLKLGSQTDLLKGTHFPDPVLTHIRAKKDSLMTFGESFCVIFGRGSMHARRRAPRPGSRALTRAAISRWQACVSPAVTGCAWTQL